MLTIDSGSNKSLYTLIAVVVFGIFLALSYFLFQDQTKGILASVVDGVEDVTGLRLSNSLGGTGNLGVSEFPQVGGSTGTPIITETHEDWVAKRIAEGYVLAKDSDFTYTYGYWQYIGPSAYVILPHVINGTPMTSYKYLFRDSSVKGVASDNLNVTDMYAMFYNTINATLDLRYLNTSNVTSMRAMFHSSKATSINLSTLNTENVTDISQMFQYSRVQSIDLSSFDLGNVTFTDYMLDSLSATTGYARTVEDANKINNSSYKKVGLNFIVKP